MAGPFTTTAVSNYNSNPPSDDGAQTAANRVQWSTQKTKLADPIKTAFDASETNTQSAFGKIMGGAGFTSTAVDYTVAASDQGKFVKVTVAGKTLTTPDATVVGSPFVFSIINNSTGSITFKGNGTQTIDGAATVSIPSGCGCMVNTDGSNWFTDGQNFKISAASLANYLSGLTLSYISTTSFGIASGVANDSTNINVMSLASAYTKTTSAWSVGTGNGGLDTGVIATSTWYHVYLIARTDTGVVDVIFSTSASAPTLPANYTLYRRIGSIKTDSSSHWVQFTQVGDDFIWAVAIVDINSQATTATRTTFAVTVPTGVVVTALFKANVAIGAASVSTLFSSLLENDIAPSTGFNDLSGVANGFASGSFSRITNTSAQIATRSNVTSSLLSVNTYGWRDNRGRL